MLLRRSSFSWPLPTGKISVVSVVSFWLLSSRIAIAFIGLSGMVPNLELSFASSAMSWLIWNSSSVVFISLINALGLIKLCQPSFTWSSVAFYQFYQFPSNEIHFVSHHSTFSILSVFILPLYPVTNLPLHRVICHPKLGFLTVTRGFDQFRLVAFLPVSLAHALSDF